MSHTTTTPKSNDPIGIAAQPREGPHPNPPPVYQGRGKSGWMRENFGTGKSILLCAFALLIASASNAAADTPDFGPNVLIFDPSTPRIQQRLDAIFAKQERGEFNSNRYACLFKPGQYKLNVNVGFYTQIVGLGQSPDDVNITGAVRSKATWRHGNATVNFWRAVENLSITPTLENDTDVWAVSQGTALRRVHVKGQLNLSDGGWSSGGFFADCKIDGLVDAGSQQQWIARNSELNGWHSGGWNMVFVGDINPPAGDWPQFPFTTIENTPVIAEMPYLFIGDAGRYFVMVPDLHGRGTRGTTWGKGKTSGKALPIDQFFIAHADKDSAASINAALEAGKNLLLTPGIYHLRSSIRVTRPDTIILGLGYPTLVPDLGTPAMIVSDMGGVKIGGILFDAGPVDSPALLQVGEAGSSVIHTGDPIFLYDIFARAGGAMAGMADSFVTINSNNVVGDNFWLWRADHGRGADWDINRNRNGLVVNGNDVTIYGLAVEHCQAYQTLWNGNRGRVYFYQSEMPYDPPSQSGWSHDGVNGFASYKIADGVTDHQAWGLGVYCVFYAAPVIGQNAIETPRGAGIRMHHMITLRFGGQPNSGIAHVINGTGAAVIDSKEARVN
jgi:hypothetical protein